MVGGHHEPHKRITVPMTVPSASRPCTTLQRKRFFAGEG